MLLTATPKRTRPAKGPRFEVVCRQEEKDAVVAAAKDAGQSISNFILGELSVLKTLREDYATLQQRNQSLQKELEAANELLENATS